jgi:hypothetical protein
MTTWPTGQATKRAMKCGYIALLARKGSHPSFNPNGRSPTEWSPESAMCTEFSGILDGGGTPGSARTLSGNCSVQVALRREQCSMSAESQNCEASRNSRCQGTALHIRPLLGCNLNKCPLLGSGSVNITL